MRSIAMGSTICAALVFAACNGTTIQPEATEFEWQGSVAGVGEWPQVTAEAAMRWVEGDVGFTAGIAIAGDRPGAVRPWHVHHNTCAQGGGIVGLDQQYPRLEIQADGTASAVANVPLAPDPAANYHVNVHRSEEEMEVIIACGDITLEGAATTPPPTIPGY
jgi:superoxide dismutase, Cu-Zn family